MIRYILLVAILTGLPMGAQIMADELQPTTKTALFAGGCFWCMESDFEKLDGVKDVTSGYSGGHTQNPTYEQTSTGSTGHAEAVQITYDPATISYEQLLEIFWRRVDPLDAGGQFCDRGDQYRAAVFYATDEEKALAEASKDVAEAALGQPIITEITAASTFYPAEDYHQGYYKKSPMKYKFYRWNCGRDQRLAELWGAAE